MSTPLTQLTNPQNTDENSEIVGEIINEMNNSDHQLHSNVPENNNDLYTNSQNAQLERQMDVSTNIMSNDNLNNISNNNLNNIDNNSRPMMHVDTFPEISLKDRILSTIREPASVAFIYFLLSSPIINGTLSTYLPKLFSNTVSNSIRWVSLGVKSIVAGVLFYILKLFL
jgi:hypothetical protein